MFFILFFYAITANASSSEPKNFSYRHEKMGQKINTESTCKPNDLTLQWPLLGSDGFSWVVNAFVDHEPKENSTRDFKNKTDENSRTYDQHQGTDIAPANFRAMDENQPVLAAADGKVSYVEDGNFDRWNNDSSATTCPSYKANQVAILHNNGFTSLYLHLKKNSIKVKVGDLIKAGSIVGTIGSSGCSSSVHLHFEVYDCSGNTVDPYEKSMWKGPIGEYKGKMGLMEVAMKSTPFLSELDVRDPPPLNPSYVKAKTPFGFATYWANITGGKSAAIKFFDPSGTFQFKTDLSFLGTKSLGFEPQWFDWRDYSLDTPGKWTFAIELNGHAIRRGTILVVK